MFITTHYSAPTTHYSLPQVLYDTLLITPFVNIPLYYLWSTTRLPPEQWDAATTVEVSLLLSAFLRMVVLAAHCSLITAHCPLRNHHSSLITHHSSLITAQSSIINHHQPPITNHQSLITNHCSLFVLPICYCSLLTTS